MNEAENLFDVSNSSLSKRDEEKIIDYEIYIYIYIRVLVNSRIQLEMLLIFFSQKKFIISPFAV